MRSVAGRTIKQRGMALLVVLMLLATMATLAVVVTERWFFSFHYSLQLHQRLQGKWYAAGAEMLAGTLLRLDANDDARHTHLSQRWAKTSQRYPLEDAELQVRIEDAQACFNLNAVAGNEDTQRIFSRLLVLLGEEPQQALRISAALADWLDDGGQPHENGAGDAEYATLEPPYLTAGQPMQDISELRQIRDIDPTLLQRLRPLVCALPKNTLNINLNTLLPDQWPLLAALVEDVDESAIRQGLLQRPPTGWETLEQPLDMIKPLAARRNYLALNSDYFHLYMVVRMADANYRQYSLLQRRGGQITVLRRHWEIEEE